MNRTRTINNYWAPIFALVAATQNAWSDNCSFTDPQVLARAKPLPDQAQYVSIYKSNFAAGLDSRDFHCNPAAVAVVPSPDNPKNRVLKVVINKTDDFSKVCNGTPRGEICFNRHFNFLANKEYLVCWNTYIPPDFQFDDQQPEIFTQIHQKVDRGVPIFALLLTGRKYQLRIRNDQDKIDTYNVDVADCQRGKWVTWKLRYRLDSTGLTSITELYKDGKLIFNGDGFPNAYPADNDSYLKIGMYKWWWKTQPSDNTRLVTYFGDVEVLMRR